VKSFESIEKLDTGILYILELTSSLSVLLLAFGLIASMANVLTKGSVLTDNLMMQRIWAWTQCIAIDASVAGTIIRTFRYHAEGERVKTWLYGLLSALLLFTAAIVLNIESVQQTLNLTLEAAYVHVFIPVEALIWVRSLAIVLLIVAHAMRHVSKLTKTPVPAAPAPTAIPKQVAPDWREMLQEFAKLQQTTIETVIERTMERVTITQLPQVEQANTALQIEAAVDAQNGLANAPARDELAEHAQSLTTGRFASKEQAVAHVLASNPNATIEQVAAEVGCNPRTAEKWYRRLKASGGDQ
jgi:hypothetical protein